jgi:CRISPR/Cas system-associated protein Cas5 (RAMP superfamily)
MFERDEKPNIFGVEIKSDYNKRPSERTGSLGRYMDDEHSPRQRSKSRSLSKKKYSSYNESPKYKKSVSPRRQIFEAKFEKYVANKENKKKIEKKLEAG